MMRWFLICCLFLTGCAMTAPTRQNTCVEMPAKPSQLHELRQAIAAFANEENRLQLDAFIDEHQGDGWGELASRYRDMSLRLEQQLRQQSQLEADAKALTENNLKLQNKLQLLQSKLDELTRSFIEQGTRQP